MSVAIKIDRDISRELHWLSAAFETTNDGRIAWPMEVDQHTFQLIASLSFVPKIPDHEKDGAIWSAINECAKNKKFDDKAFIRHLREAIVEIRSKPTSAHSVLAQINVPKKEKIPKSLSSYYGSIVPQARILPSQLRILKEEHAFETRLASFEDDFLFVRAKIKARDGRSALGEGIRSIQFALGLLNLASQGYGLSKRFGIPSVPLGKYLLSSPVIVVDQDNKKMGGWISDSSYPRQFKFNFTARRDDLDDLATYTKRWIKRIGRVDFPDRLATAIVLFQEGLSATQVDVALIKLWTCIELVTSRADGREPLEKAIERASSIFRPPEMTRVRLDFIANSRHAVVHKGESGEHSLLCAQWASIYAGELLRFAAFNKHKLTKYADILDYLSSPISEPRLKQNIRMSKLRLRALAQRAKA
ncbi:hypothetical protein [Bradyrhizobium sp. 144]|uniref:hypothetical protein n=1 Tax=Bradyrhizobium sp. 144 TaxID=2782620 RepID=UPI001FFA6B5F|nr:hypothetical protein [Bradyrhizobium sp. 144]MCK1698156.1 hypothetical protein [Bradyrhizobium sp. 144]